MDLTAVPIDIDILDISESELGISSPFAQLDGDIIADSSAVDSSSIFALAPLGMVRWNQYTEEAFLMFSNENTTDEDVMLEEIALQLRMGILNILDSL